MNQLSTFQIVVTGMFIAFILIGVGVFAAFGGFSGGKGSVGAVVIWGEVDGSIMTDIINTLRATDKSFQNVTYVQKDSQSYDTQLVNAMASGSGPDLFLMSQDEIQTFSDKITLIPFSSVSQGSFVSSFVDEGQLFLTSQGSLALPFKIDPLVMYWNRDLFANAGVANPPQYWNDFLTLAPKITSLDQGTNVKRSAVALGTWSNIANAKAILSALFIQAGDGIIVRGDTGAPQVVFGTKAATDTTSPAESALRFYTEFANPSKTTYSWNRSLSEAGDAFTAGDVAVYFGFASEYQSIASRNPNLHFSVALLPQIQGNAVSATYGSLSGLAISHTAHNPTGALTIAVKLSGAAAAAAVAAGTNLPPVRRDVAVDTSSNAAAGVFVQSALIAHGWLDPNAQSTDSIFQGMIESVAKGASDPAQAVSDASQELQQLVPR